MGFLPDEALELGVAQLETALGNNMAVTSIRLWRFTKDRLSVADLVKS